MLQKFSISGREKERKNTKVNRKSSVKKINSIKSNENKDKNSIDQDVLNSLLRLGNIK